MTKLQEIYIARAVKYIKIVQRLIKIFLKVAYIPWLRKGSFFQIFQVISPSVGHCAHVV